MGTRSGGRARLRSAGRLATAVLVPLFTLTGARLALAGCGEPATPIASIQGAGAASPMAGTRVTVEGVVTLDARYSGGFRGFYLQQADAETDADPATSEALFVHTRDNTGDAGKRLRVSGQVREYHGLTEITRVSAITDCGTADLPGATALGLPWAGGRPEHLENMRVRVPGSLTVIDSFDLGRYGQVTLAPERQFVPTQLLAPGAPAMAMARHQQQQRLVLDDGRGEKHPRPVAHPPPALAYDNPVRLGDRVRKLEGVLDFRFGHWRIQPLEAPEFAGDNPRAPAPARPPGANLRVMSLNLHNYFNGDGQGGGFPTARGAHSGEVFRLQTRRLVATQQAVDPDILAVMELENDGDDPHSAVATLTRAMGSHWRFVAAAEHAGNDAIRVALLYRQDRVEPVGEPAGITSGPFRAGNRPPLAQDFRLGHDGPVLRIVAAHLKSKSCRNARGRQQDQGDGQGCFAATRAAAAGALGSWLANRERPDHLVGTLIAGDLNSYAMEAPLDRLAETGFTDLVRHFHDRRQVSFSFRGRSGTLDYHLADPALLAATVTSRIWASNAEEPPVLGYPARPPLTGRGTGPWRASDHNPVITDLRL